MTQSAEIGDITGSGSSAYDVAGSRLVTQYEFTRGHEVFRRSMAYYVHTTGHLTRLLDEAGFTVLNRWSDMDGTPFTLGAPHVAHRPSAVAGATGREAGRRRR
ncbi:MAG TPA: hypothetical protein VNA11_19520 [Pseudonocardia sp.]|nr:hypothetical protein [Pseudonocardia sp.]